MSFPLTGTIAIVSIGGVAVVLWLVYGIRAGAPLSPFRFTVGQLGGFTWRGLVVSSILGLYLELLLIRWISSEIRIFAYFKNFVLIACFLGFGLGCFLCRRAVSIAMLVAPLLFLTTLIALPWQPLRLLIRLRNGARHVTAVEIDPLIIELGKKFHPEHPYASTRVTIINDDARSYIQNTTERYDMIVFALLDSHTTSSQLSNIRIDNYVYTLEALRAARRLLTEDGVFVLRFQVLRPWIGGRLHDMMRSVFGYEPLQMSSEPDVYSTGGNFFIAGAAPKIRAALRDPALAAYAAAHAGERMEHVTLPTDDWPYLYQHEPGLPASVVTISLLLLLVCGFGAQRVGLHLRSIRWEFFFLGAAFLLLEALIISRMALLFGTTWIVNSIVIAVLLTLIVAANGVAARWPRIPVAAGYAGVLITIAICWLLPLEAIFFHSFALRAVASTLVLCSPVFFAGIVFIKRFAAVGFAADAIGANLLGALAGGIIESASLWLGLRALLAIAFVLYAAAALASRRAMLTPESSSADRPSAASVPSSPAPVPE